jgi:hypothetical protein
MNRQSIVFLLGVSLSVLGFSPNPVATAVQPKPDVIVSPREASWMEQLAAREVRRYVYLRTGRLLPMMTEPQGALPGDEVILVARKDRPLARAAAGAELAASLSSLAPQSYRLRTIPRQQSPATRRLPPAASPRALLVTGGDDAGTLYAAYRLAELLGVRFYLHGDVVPDERMEWKLPELDERGAPLFALRGIQPFHDFPEGPDWWNRDDYLAVIGQLPKLRMNFFGLHTYPEGRPNAEPTVWIGRAGDLGEHGQVKFSYPSSYMNTLRGNWGYAPEKTGDYACGSAALFERDDFGPEVMFGFMPSPATPEASNEVFDRAAGMLRAAFSFAHQMGVKTCVGTETPLIVPKLVQDRLKAQGKNPADLPVVRELYEGIFRRATEAYPLDYYWFWTPEGWTWSEVKEQQIKATMEDLTNAIAAREKVQAPFHLATCGWVLGPPQDRAMFDKALPKEVAVSCINRQVGYTPVDAGFAEVHGRSKWAIPWLEDDPALTSPQLWAGRMRRDAADALRYGCDGLMGIHWRTRALGPNIGALAQAAWEQGAWAEAYQAAAAAAPVTKPILPSTKDFYADWAPRQFGPEAGAAAAAIFEKIDGALPKPCTWIAGPGGIKPDGRPWEQVKQEYAFVDEFAALGPQVKGAGNRERYDYWLEMFLYLRAIGEVNCAWGDYNRVMERVKQQKDAAAQRDMARQLALPARVKLAGLVGVVFDHLLATVSTTGELGTVANWNQHNLPGLLKKPGEELARILGEPLPANAQLGQSYHGPMRIIVPTTRTSLAANEALRLKVIILSEAPPRAAALCWRKLGERRFAKIPLKLLARGVYSVQLPASAKDDFEYYLQAEPKRGQPVYFPATAPNLNQTVVICSPAA